MQVGSSVRHAIEDYELYLAGHDEARAESSVLHACNAIDGTAKKHPGIPRGNRARFTQILRANYDILGPMALPGIDLATRFPDVAGPGSDVAEIVYKVHRCTQGHGDELPQGFELVPSQGALTQLTITKDTVALPQRLIFGLLAIAVLDPFNGDQSVPEGFYLTHGHDTYLINDWWGRRDHFVAELARKPQMPVVRLDFGDWSSP